MKKHNKTAEAKENPSRSKAQLDSIRKASVEKRKKDPTCDKKMAVSKSVNAQLFESGTVARYQNKHINEAVANVIISEMFDVTPENEESWIQTYAHNYLETAKNEPKSAPAAKIADALFNSNFLNQLQEHIDRLSQKDLEFYKYLIRSDLYDKQQQVFDDHIDRKHLIINSRRSGKTFLMGRLLAREAMSPGCEIAYINRTSSAAIRQIKKPLEDALKKANLTIAKGSVEAQDLTLSNGTRLLIIGNNNAGDIDKLRGESLRCIVMDECGHQRNTKILIREVIEPAMIDYGSESKLYMVGTPPRTPGTFVEEIWNNAIQRGWKTWHWTFMDNPTIPDRDKVIDEVCKEHGVDKDSAFIRREYFGEMDAYDTEALWIKKFVVSPEEQISPDVAYVGVDWGFEDKAAVVSVVADKQRGQAYVVDSWSEAKRGITEITEEIQRQALEIKKRFGIDPMVICDTNEKGAVWDLYSTYHMRNVFLAYKYDLDYAQDQLSEMFATNKIVVVSDPSGSVQEDIQKSVWKRDPETDKILHELDDDVWHPNSLMALLYVSRQFAYDVLGWIDHNKAARDIIEGKA